MAPLIALVALTIGAALVQGQPSPHSVVVGSFPIQDGGFRQQTAGAAHYWQTFGDSRFIPSGGRIGEPALELACDGKADAGAVQTIAFQPGRQGPFVVSAWARCDHVADGGDCALWLDVLQEGGPPIWGVQGIPDRTRSQWQRVSAEVRPSRPVREVKVYLLLRHTVGRVRFAGVAAQAMPIAITKLQLYPEVGRVFDVRATLSQEVPWSVRAEQAGKEIWRRSGSLPQVADRFEAPGAGAVRVTLTARRDGTSARASTTVLPRSGAVPYDWWVADSFTRIFPDDIPPAHAARRAALDVARGERQSFQICVRPFRSPLRRVTATVSALRSGSKLLPAARIRQFRVGYVRVNLPFEHPFAVRRSASWWPDPLLPPAPLDVPAREAQPIWLTVDAPASAAPGEYAGRVTLRAAGVRPEEIPITVRIHRAVVPVQGHMRTAFALMDGYLRKLYGDVPRPLRRAYTDYLLQHRLNPDDISRYNPPDLDELSYADKRGLNAFNILNVVPEPDRPVTWICLAPLDAYTPAFRKRFFERLDAIVPELRRRGLANKAYIYGFDERDPEYAAVIKDIFGEIHRRYPEIRTASTCHLPEGGDPLALNIDWFVPLSSSYSPKMALSVRRRGGQVWWYVCMGPNYPYANWLLENPLVEARLIWWQAFQYDVEGFLYWGLNIWERAHNDAPIPYAAGPHIDWSVTTGGDYPSLNGDGELLYPGVHGPIGSVRMENIRDGLQDSELLRLYRQRFGAAAAARIVHLVSIDRTHYSRDPSVLLAARRKMLQALDR
jgi:hypothetical protein